MAKAELKNGKDPQLKMLATNIISAPQREIAQMRKHVGSAGATGTMDATPCSGHSG